MRKPHLAFILVCLIDVSAWNQNIRRCSKRSSCPTACCRVSTSMTLVDQEKEVKGKFEKLVYEGKPRKAVDYMRKYENELVLDQKIAQQLITQVGDEVLLTASSGMSNVSEKDISVIEEDLVYLYTNLKQRNILNGFKSITATLIPYPDKFVSQEKLEELTNMKMEALAPGRGVPWLYAGAALCLAEIAIGQQLNVDPLQFMIPATIGLFGFDRILFNGSIFETVARFVNPSYKAKIVRHEAGHLLLAYLLGCPISGCLLDPWKVRKYVRGSQGGTVFVDEMFSNGIMTGNISKWTVDRFSIVLMGGIAAEALMFGKAEGGASDESTLITLLSTIQPPFTYSMIKMQARWAALQAVLLLRQYKAVYEELVTLLERNEPIGNCIFAIENSLQSNQLLVTHQDPSSDGIELASSTSEAPSRHITRMFQQKLKRKDVERVLNSSGLINAALSSKIQAILNNEKAPNQFSNSLDESGFWLRGFDPTTPPSEELPDIVRPVEAPKAKFDEGAEREAKVNQLNKRLEEIEEEKKRFHRC